jgi:hypothetical protein
MSRVRLVLRRSSEFVDSAPMSLFEGPDLGRPYFPGRGVFYSICIHIAVFVSLIFLTLFRSIPDPPLVANQMAFIRPHFPKVLMYLPLLEPAGQFIRFPAPKEKTSPRRAPESRAPETKGLSYPGPQKIVSDPPNPTNMIQTILQPDIERPQILVPPLPVPNLVQIADVTSAMPKITVPPLEPVKEEAPEPPKPVKETPPPPEVNEPEPEMVLPALELTPATRMEAPKIMLPPSTPPILQAKPSERPVKLELPGQMKAKAPPPEPEPEPKPKPEPPQPKAADAAKPASAPKTNEMPKEPPVADPSSATRGEKNLLALSPMPASPKDPVKVPPGEARGRFVISPEPNLAAIEKDPGMKTGNRSTIIEVAKKPAPPAEETAPKTPPAISKADIGKTAGVKSPAVANGGTGAERGSKPGSSSGTGNPAGSGATQGSGKRPFSGITIIGGDVDPGEIPNDAPVKRARRPLQTSYGLSVISTEDSGGGLPFVGVFSNEQIYTVYLDMRESELENDPSWTLEFAVIPGSAARANNPGSPVRSQQGLILPFPAEKIKPVLPVELVRRHPDRMIIAYAVIGTDGKMDQITIEQSPDNQLDEPVAEALAKWVFRPAQLNGEPVAVKVLLGIPLWLPE